MLNLHMKRSRNMVKVSNGKKQYTVLFCLAVAVSLVLPMIGYCLEIKFMMNSTLINIIFTILNVLSSFGTAILVFTSFRYKFKYCLPFVFLPIILTIFDEIFIFIYDKSQVLYSNILLNRLINFAFTSIFSFVIVGISKLASKNIKKEIFAVPITLIGILIFGLINFVLQIIILKQSYFLTIKSYIPTILHLFCSCILMFVAYYILKFAFSENKKALLAKAASGAKKLWNKTAE